MTNETNWVTQEEQEAFWEQQDILQAAFDAYGEFCERQEHEKEQAYKAVDDAFAACNAWVSEHVAGKTLYLTRQDAEAAKAGKVETPDEAIQRLIREGRVTTLAQDE